ncbi:MAG TPA: glycosyltransferase family protein [Anaerolineaceae bacterium]|nr:glycosyltransferase family protein [Anaerolineaceae bacterium]
MTHPRIIAIVQARMTSSRLPGKVLLDLGGQPALAWVINRARRASLLSGVLVATTADPADDPIAGLCAQLDAPCFRGHPFDVLDRYYQAARSTGAAAIIRITADCPLVDPEQIDELITAFYEQGADFACNRLPPPWHRTYPIGLDLEMCSLAGLEQAWREATLKHEREHVMPYFYDEPGRFKVLQLNAETDYGHLRWTLDTPADLEVLRIIFDHFKNRPDFSWRDVLAFWLANPQLAPMNAAIQHKTMTDVDDRYQPASGEK